MREEVICQILILLPCIFLASLVWATCASEEFAAWVKSLKSCFHVWNLLGERKIRPGRTSRLGVNEKDSKRDWERGRDAKLEMEMQKKEEPFYWGKKHLWCEDRAEKDKGLLSLQRNKVHLIPRQIKRRQCRPTGKQECLSLKRKDRKRSHVSLLN